MLQWGVIKVIFRGLYSIIPHFMTGTDWLDPSACVFKHDVNKINDDHIYLSFPFHKW